MFNKYEKRRIIFAFVIIICIFAFIASSSILEKQNELDNLINFEKNYSSELPENFYEEVINTDSVNAMDIKVSDDKKIVGFNMTVSAEKSFQIIKNKLAENNWKCLGNASCNYANFIKDEGEYTWLFINCVDVYGGSSVIFTKD